MPLTEQQKADFIRDGYVHLPGIIPQPIVETALRAINHKIGLGIPQDQLRTWTAQSFFPDINRTPVIGNLVNESPLPAVLEDLLGEGNVPPLSGGQLALRFPREPGTEARPPIPHIDGLATETNGVPKGTLSSFTALIGIFLTDVVRDDAGNFTVWPGSHRKMETYFREHGIAELLDGHTPKLDYGTPIQINAKAGDAVLAHYQLLHGVAHNVSPWPRFAVFFRVKHPMHNEHRLECLTDLWKEWPGLERQVAVS